MKEGVLDIEGKTYVSSARAAGLVGYTKDYVGQLARAGKLDARLIGRSWYVSEDSIRQHKLITHYTLTKQKKKPKQEESPSDEKTKVDEKTIRNKDISLRKEIYDVQRPPRSSLKEIRKKSTAVAQRELMQANITYEAGERLDYEDDATYLPPVRRPANSSPSMRKGENAAPGKVNLHKVASPMPHTSPHLMPQDAVNPSVDGVSVTRVVEGGGPVKKESSHVSKGITASTYTAPPPVSVQYDAETRQGASKRLPVLAGLVAFLVFCAWYWLR